MIRRPSHAQACQIAETFLAEFPEQLGAQDIQTHGKLLIAAVRAFDVIVGNEPARRRSQTAAELMDRAREVVRRAIDDHRVAVGHDFHIHREMADLHVRLLWRLLENLQEEAS